MFSARRVMLIGLGAILLAVSMIAWKYVTDASTELVEKLWCAVMDDTECRLRGYQHFLTWNVTGIINILLFGFLLNWLSARSRN